MAKHENFHRILKYVLLDTYHSLYLLYDIQYLEYLLYVYVYRKGRWKYFIYSFPISGNRSNYFQCLYN